MGELYRSRPETDGKIIVYFIDNLSYIKVLSILTISCTVFANRKEN